MDKSQNNIQEILDRQDQDKLLKQHGKEIVQKAIDALKNTTNFTKIPSAEVRTLISKKILQILNGIDANTEISLPIERFKEEIIQKINENPVTIITAETGAGKTTQVPQYLLDAGYEVIVTQPRRIAARSVAKRVAHERHCKLGDEVGFQTSREKQSGPRTRLLFCTDGLQLVRELTGSGIKGKKTVLILDEVHEWNINMETLIAWGKKQLEKGIEFKIVVMSATLDAGKLIDFFENEKREVPFIDVPGKIYPIETVQSSPNAMISEIANLAKQGRNILVFQPGKKEIQQTISALEDLNLNAEIFPLHGNLDPCEQQKVFKHYNRPKIIVSTNIAQTSVTIDDIDAVVDSGIERRIETSNGVEGLYLRDTSTADCLQRKGRAGRCKPGIYVLCSDSRIENRDPFPKPEIQRVLLDQMVLRLTSSGIDATKLDFYHQPKREELENAKKTLIALGAITQEDEITKIGKQISRMPISVRSGRMIVEAMKNGCVDDVLTIAACMEAGSLRARGNSNWKKLINESTSDVLAELELYKQARKMKTQEMQENGIFVKAFFRATEIRKHIAQRLRGNQFNAKENNTLTPDEKKEIILRSVAAGMIDNLYINNCGDYENGDDERKLSRESVVDNSAKWIVGMPFNIARYRLLQFCSKINPMWLPDIAPHLTETAKGDLFWSNETQEVIQEKHIIFNGARIATQNIAADTNSDSFDLFYKALANHSVKCEIAQKIKQHNKSILQETRAIWIRSGGEFPEPDHSTEIALYKEILGKHQITTLTKFESLMVKDVNSDQLKLNFDEIISSAQYERIKQNNPTEIILNGKTYEVEYCYTSYNNKPFYSNIKFNTEDISKITNEDMQNVINLKTQLNLILTQENYSNYSSTNIEDLRNKVEERRLEKLKNDFLKNNPNIVFDINDDLPSIPKPQIYDEKTGAMLYAGYEKSYWGRNCSIKWYISAENAEKNTQIVKNSKAASEAKQYFNKAYSLIQSIQFLIRKSDLEKRDSDDFKNQISDLQEKLNNAQETSFEIPLNIISELASIEEQIKIAEENKRQGELEKKLQITKQIESGEILVNFHHHHRRGGMANNSDAWVIRADGSLRDPDEKTCRPYKSDGDYIWNKVEKEEIALTWRCVSQRDIAKSDCFIAKNSTNELTSQQKNTIKEIEKNLGITEGAFGFDPEIIKQGEKIIEEMIEKITNVKGQSVNLSNENMDYFMLCSNTGISIDYLLQADQLIDWNNSFSESCDNREAQLVLEIPIINGFAQVLIYDKNGYMNVNLRFSEISAMSIDSSTNGDSLFGNKLRSALGITETEEIIIPKPQEEKIEREIEKKPKTIKPKTTVQSPLFPPLNEIAEDVIYQEYEQNETKIDEILKKYSNINNLFLNLQTAENDLMKAEDNLQINIQRRDQTKNENKRKRFAKQVADLREKRKSLKNDIKELHRQTSKLIDVKTRLDNLKLRQQDIEKFV